MSYTAQGNGKKDLFIRLKGAFSFSSVTGCTSAIEVRFVWNVL